MLRFGLQSKAACKRAIKAGKNKRLIIKNVF